MDVVMVTVSGLEGVANPGVALAGDAGETVSTHANTCLLYV